MNLVIFGPPGVGKGTQSNLLVNRLGMTQISTGDLLRNSIKNETQFGIQAREYIDRGDLVPDYIVNGMLEEAVAEYSRRGSKKGLILDGYPRTVVQAGVLNDILKNHFEVVDKAVFLVLSESAIVERLSGRRICRDCGAIYHIQKSPSSVDGSCDKCGGSLFKRSDDNEEVIRARLEIYNRSVYDLQNYYRNQGILSEVDASGSSDDVFEKLKNCINAV